MTERLASVSTPWTNIIAAQQNPALLTKCLEQLSEKYREPIRIFIQRTLDINQPDKAEDLSQMFLLHFIESNHLGLLDKERGRLRNWLMTSVRRFVLDEIKKGKRGNQSSPFYKMEQLPANANAIPDKSSLSPEEEFNRRWARELFSDTVVAFRRYCGDKGKPHYFQVFERHVLSGEKTETPSYEETATELMISTKDVANYLARAKKKFQSLLREMVRSTVASDEEVDAELQDLLRYFR